MTQKKKIYVLDYKLKWSIFKKLRDQFVQDDGPTPVGIDKILWHMLRDRQIYCWFDPEQPGDMGLGLHLPEGKEIELITNPK